MESMSLSVTWPTDSLSTKRSLAVRQFSTLWIPASIAPPMTNYPLIGGTRNITESMSSNNLKRYVGHATPSIPDRQEKPTWKGRLVTFHGRMMYPRAYKELISFTEPIMLSDLDWNIVRFIAPHDKPKTGHVRAGLLHETNIGFKSLEPISPLSPPTN